MVWTRHEGRPSNDGRYWALMAQDQTWQVVAFLVYDLDTNQVISTRDVRGVPGVEEGIDHVTMSSLGTYLLASFDRYCDPGELGSDTDPCGLMVYDRDLGAGRGLLRTIGHYDTVLDATGGEIIVYQDIDEDSIATLDLDSGAVSQLWPIDFSHTAIGIHFSGCGTDYPGWGLVSTHDDDPSDHTWMDDQVFAVELVPGGRVVRLAHTHSVTLEDGSEEAYWAEPHATVNRGLDRVVFSTNWGRTDSGETDVFLIDLPTGWIDRLQ
jgi:hypothetical protein